MYKSYALLQVKPDCFDDFLMLMKSWKAASGLPEGFLSAVPFQSDDDPNRIMLSVVFLDRDSYHACTLRTEMDEAYLQMTSLLECPPEWQAGED